MPSHLARRVSKLEATANRPMSVILDPAPLTPEERYMRWQNLQWRAAQGDPDARWRVERVNMFLETARRRQAEGLTAEEDIRRRAGTEGAR